MSRPSRNSCDFDARGSDHGALPAITRMLKWSARWPRPARRLGMHAVRASGTVMLCVMRRGGRSLTGRASCLSAPAYPECPEPEVAHHFRCSTLLGPGDRDALPPFPRSLRRVPSPGCCRLDRQRKPARGRCRSHLRTEARAPAMFVASSGAGRSAGSRDSRTLRTSAGTRAPGSEHCRVRWRGLI